MKTPKEIIIERKMSIYIGDYKRFIYTDIYRRKSPDGSNIIILGENKEAIKPYLTTYTKDDINYHSCLYWYSYKDALSYFLTRYEPILYKEFNFMKKVKWGNIKRIEQ